VETKNDDYAGKKEKIKRKLLEITDWFWDSTWLPEYERYGYDTIEEFMNGFHWIVKKRKNKNLCYGVRNEYYVTPVIVNPTDKDLYFNFYKHPINGEHYDNIETLNRSDSNLFNRV
jgi:hypothetical protein